MNISASCLQSMLMNAINASCHRKANRRVEFPIFYSSQTIHEINKLCTAAKNNYEPKYQKKLKDDIQISIQLDKPILIDSLSPNSTPSCFKLVFKSCPELLAPLVTKIFNTIIKSKQWPDFWKCSTIKSVLKSGNPENVENYRLISKLPQLSLTP